MHEIKMSTFSNCAKVSKRGSEAEESRKADVNKRATRTVSNDVCGRRVCKETMVNGRMSKMVKVRGAMRCASSANRIS